jgi:hypothetical protein
MGSAEPRDIGFRERWWKQILDDPEVDEGLLAAALAISTTARRDGTRALMSRQRLAKIIKKSDATAKRRTWRLRELGYLQLVEQGRRRGDGEVTANVYDLSLRVTQMTHRDDPQRVTQMTHWEEFSTGQNDVSTGQNSVSTGHPDDLPPLNPPLYPPNTWPTADAASSATPPGEHSKQLARDAIAPGPATKAARAKDERLFRQILEVDHLDSNDGRRIPIAELYLDMRWKPIAFPGAYLQKIDDDRGLDDYLANEHGMTRSE